MKTIILGGFLGSGKTTVLLKLAKRMVSNAKEGKTPVVIIENEIGDISVDTKMLGAYEVRELFSGCVCCTLAGDLTANAKEIAEKYDPEYLIVEATGVAHPHNIVNVMEEYIDRKDLLCVVLADASRWSELMEDMEVFVSNQLKGADCILLNKCDLVTDEERDKLLEDLKSLNGKAKILPISALGDKNEWLDEILR